MAYTVQYLSIVCFVFVQMDVLKLAGAVPKFDLTH